MSKTTNEGWREEEVEIEEHDRELIERRKRKYAPLSLANEEMDD